MIDDLRHLKNLKTHASCELFSYQGWPCMMMLSWLISHPKSITLERMQFILPWNAIYILCEPMFMLQNSNTTPNCHSQRHLPWRMGRRTSESMVLKSQSSSTMLGKLWSSWVRFIVVVVRAHGSGSEGSHQVSSVNSNWGWKPMLIRSRCGVSHRCLLKLQTILLLIWGMPGIVSSLGHAPLSYIYISVTLSMIQQSFQFPCD